MNNTENIFATLKHYADGYTEVARRKFNNAEIAAVRSSNIVKSTWGKSVCFVMYGGGMTYIPLSRDSKLEIGDTLDVANAELVVLERNGERITRVVEVQ